MDSGMKDILNSDYMRFTIAISLQIPDEPKKGHANF